ncbi:MAG: ATP-binding protein [Acidobacteriota bacterium]
MFRKTAAWRLSMLTTIAFAIGTAASLVIAHLMVSHTIRERSDVWLRGEIEVLADITEITQPTGARIQQLKNAAELALQEVAPKTAGQGSPGVPVFFLATARDGHPLLWLGPDRMQPFLDALATEDTFHEDPRTVEIDGWNLPFRVASGRTSSGEEVFLGLSDENALIVIHKMAWTFGEVWLGMVVFGLMVSFLNARGILRRVDRITETAAQVGSEELQKRVPDVGGSDEIARLTATFNSMLDRIENAVEQIHAISDGVAHDLLSPVTSVRGTLEMALTNGKPENLREAAATAIDGLDRLLRILNSSLDMAEAEAGALRLHREDVDLGDIATEMIEIYQPAAEEHGLTLRGESNGTALALVDPDLTRRALANLLDNALQYLPRGRHVVVSAKRGPHAVELTVADDGPGFPHELRGKIFERYVKGPHSRGFGIGLSLVRAIARANGGEASIGVSSAGGGLVTLSFPRAGGMNKMS